eukprot:CAMPEP_0115858352 /NCGR_PEP_ID=MMETSP0287-20121206/16052_1 /TAXON_ID=412157 /ORGANISM="Chrysochromulina rotalis, Strain UIO044" /LENGTH=371 /DNA_ID=CAMNT_0003312611 /DNA_START=16 /DNA_END=1131 /DNA_ORIENTATION=-
MRWSPLLMLVGLLCVSSHVQQVRVVTPVSASLDVSRPSRGGKRKSTRMFDETGDWLVGYAQRQRLLEPSEEMEVTSAVKEHGAWRRTHEELAEQLGRQPTDADLGDAVGFPDLGAFDDRRKCHEEAWRSIILSNLRLVVSIARPFARRSGMSLQDLIQEGTMGLIIAAEKFKPEMGYKFSTYATHWIRQSVRRAVLNDCKPVRIPAYMHGCVYSIRRERAAIYYTTGSNPSKEELAEKLNLETGRLDRALEAEAMLYQHAVSLDELIRDMDVPRVSQLADAAQKTPGSDLRASEKADGLSNLLRDVLDEDEVKVMSMRYGLAGREALTCVKISSKLDISVRRVRNLSHRAVRKLRRAACDPEVAALLLDEA